MCSRRSRGGSRRRGAHGRLRQLDARSRDDGTADEQSARRRLRSAARGGGALRSVPAGAEILGLIGAGLTNREIGKRLYLSEKTIKNHISRLLAELGVERRIQAAVLATQAASASGAGPGPHGT